MGERCFEYFLSCTKSCFLVLSFVHCSPLSKHRAIDRVFWCSPSRTKSCFLLLSLVPKIVLFGALLRAKNRALDRAFWCSPSCTKSCFLVLSFVPQIVLFGASLVPKIVAIRPVSIYIYNYDISFHILPPQAPPWLAPKKHLQTTDVRPQSRSRRLFLKPLGAETLEGCPMEQTT